MTRWIAPKGPDPTHDWASLFDGAERVIKQGIDFQCSLRSMKVMLYTKAPNYGGRCTARRIKGDPKALRIRFIPASEEGASE